MGNARASVCGIGNGLDSRAFSFMFQGKTTYHVALGACRKHKEQQMNKFKLKMLLVVMATGLLWSPTLSAQEQNGRPGGLFGENNANTSNGLMNKSSGTAGGYFTGQGFGATGAELTGQTFGEEAPLGSGLLVLLAASAGYATLKTKKKQQNRKENKA